MDAMAACKNLIKAESEEISHLNEDIQAIEEQQSLIKR